MGTLVVLVVLVAIPYGVCVPGLPASLLPSACIAARHVEGVVQLAA